MLEEYKEFLDLRRWFLGQIGKALKTGVCHKSYEGTFELNLTYPHYFDELNDGETNSPDYVQIKLNCYVIGPSRHYDWNGRSIHDAVVKCRKDLEQWCKEDIEED